MNIAGAQENSDDIGEIAGYSWVIGLSVGPEEIHVCLVKTKNEQIFTAHFSNTITGLHQLKKWNVQLGNTSFRDCLACVEYAGSNIQAIVLYLMKIEVKVWLRTALQVRRNLRLTVDENNVDAARIANFALRNQRKAVAISLEGLKAEKLKSLQDNSKRIAKAILILNSSVAKVALYDEETARTIENINSAALNGLKESLSLVDETISYYTFSLKLSRHQNISHPVKDSRSD